MQGRKHLWLGLWLVLVIVLALGSLPWLPIQTPAWAGTAAGPRWGADVMPSVPNQEVAAAIKKEGSKLVVSGFASGEVRTHYHPLWFQEWVREIYGVPIQVQFVPAEGDQIIEQLKAVKQGE